MLKIGIIREGKEPPDARAPLSPEQCAQVQGQFPLRIVVQPSPVRCFRDAEYTAQGIALQADLTDCDILMGVKEVPVERLLGGKTYFFFSHTIKKQAHNRSLLQAVLAQQIRLIDYETLTDDHGERLVAFGFYAGVVGAHNALWAYGRRTGAFTLPRMAGSHDYAEVKDAYARTEFPPLRIVLTGGGRVAAGAIRNLHDMGIKAVAPDDFLKHEFDHPVFTQLFAQDYVRHPYNSGIFDKPHFYAHGEEYLSTFAPYYRRTDIFINGIFYDRKAPAFFTLQEMRQPDFRIQVIADITCDIMPDSSVPATLRPATIAAPVYGFDPKTGEETPAFQPGSVDVMAIDNLPSELPRDASVFFGQQLIDHVMPELAQLEGSAVLRRATIAQGGALTEGYGYLGDYASTGPTS